ncbi:MAG: hypothetical protein C0467_18385 [Planctomycetaceae bacterium]|nr:hypothetical protein [Planctomycetaceae bacterium]
MSPRWRLILAAFAFLSWIVYLGYAAAMKSRDPIVSHIQAAAAPTAVVAEVTALDAKVTVSEKLSKDGPEGVVEVLNLAETRGFANAGKYLLYLEPRHGAWLIVGQQRSPGNDISGVGKPLIYPWTDDVRKQAEKLRKPEK